MSNQPVRTAIDDAVLLVFLNPDRSLESAGFAHGPAQKQQRRKSIIITPALAPGGQRKTSRIV